MPRDKSQTTDRIIRNVRDEFLTYGYEKASLNRVSERVGITTAGLYKHFRNKEDMFYFLVKDTLSDFYKLTEQDSIQMEEITDHNPFDSDWATFWTDFIFSHYDGVKLLICCSKGSKYESFEEEAIRIEAEGNKQYAELLQRAGKSTKIITDMQWHILSTTYVHLIFEIVRHDMNREEAYNHLLFVSELIYPGWKTIFGLS